MTYFLKSGSRFSVTTKQVIDLHEQLPVGTYAVGFNEMSGEYFLKIVDDLEISGKVYGNTAKRAERILNTFHEREGSTGVWLDGEKGSGKTLLAKQISVDARKKDIPTIIINQPYCGEGFNMFIQMIEQPVVVIFDEFEKVYDSGPQQKLLTLLDGVYTSKKLFVLTTNDSYRVDGHMQNRPGRIFYRFDYDGLEAEFIREYCEDNLNDKSHIDSMCRMSTLFPKFNFDILKAMVEEMNRYGESIQEVMQFINAKPQSSVGTHYEYVLEFNGEILLKSKWSGNPLVDSVDISFNTEDGWGEAEFNISDLDKIDAASGLFLYSNAEGYKLRMKKEPATVYNWNAF